MAKKRYINTRFWNDTYVANLDPSEKLLFLYCLTNQYTDICGIYEVPLKSIALDTGLDKEMVIKIIHRFAKDDKIFYIDGWIYVKNFQKHQAINDSIKQGIDRSLKDVPNNIIAKITEIDTECTQSVPRVYPDGGDTLLKPKPILKPTPNMETDVSGEIEYISEEKNPTENKQIFAVLTAFININPALKLNNRTQRAAIKSLIDIMGYEDLKKWTKYAILIQGQRFAPTITTPCMLLNKIAELKIYHHKNSNSQIISI